MADVVEVPGATEMSDETFWKHFNARHLQDIGLDAPMEWSPLYSDDLLETHRSFHRRCHNLTIPSQYDHEHTEEN